MPTTREPRRQLTLLHMVLWVACCAALCRNLQIILEHRDDVRAIWEQITR